MREQSDIDRSRREKRRKRRLKQLAVVTVLVLIVAFVWSNRKLFTVSAMENTFKTFFEGMKRGDGYPKDLTKGTPRIFTNMGDSLCVVTDFDYYVSNGSAHEMALVDHSFDDPSLSHNGKLAVLYGRGTKELRLMSKVGQLESLVLSAPIVCATISPDNLIFVAIQSDRYQNEVLVFDRYLNELYRWYSAEDYVVSLGSYGNGKMLVTCLKAQGGELCTVVYGVDIGKEEPEFRIEINDLTPVYVGYDGGQIFVIGTDRAVKLDREGNEVASYDYAGQNLLSFRAYKNRYFVLAFGDNRQSALNKILVLDKSLSESSKLSFPQEIVDIKTESNYFVVLSQSEIVTYSYKGEDEKRYSFDGIGVELALTGKNAYLLTQDKIMRLKLS